MKIELGQKYENGPCCAPDSPKGESKMHYPSLYFTHDEPVDLPDEGTAVITFRKIESSENVRDPEDPKYRCEIEVHTIEVNGGKKSEEGMASMADALKVAMRKKMKQGEYEEED